METARPRAVASCLKCDLAFHHRPEGRPAPNGLRKAVSFDEGDAGAVILSSDHGGVIAGREEGDDGGLAIIARRELGRYDGLWLAGLPVVVEVE
jgi:hypothetical protein